MGREPEPGRVGGTLYSNRVAQSYSVPPTTPAPDTPNSPGNVPRNGWAHHDASIHIQIDAVLPPPPHLFAGEDGSGKGTTGPASTSAEAESQAKITAGPAVTDVSSVYLPRLM